MSSIHILDESICGAVDVAIRQVASINLFVVEINNSTIASVEIDSEGRISLIVFELEAVSKVRGHGGCNSKVAGSRDLPVVVIEEDESPRFWNARRRVGKLPIIVVSLDHIANRHVDRSDSLGSSKTGTHENTVILIINGDVAAAPAVIIAIFNDKLVDTRLSAHGHSSETIGWIALLGVDGLCVVAKIDADSLLVATDIAHNIDREDGVVQRAVHDRHGDRKGAVVAHRIASDDRIRRRRHHGIGNASDRPSGGIQLQRQLERGTDSKVAEDIGGDQEVGEPNLVVADKMAGFKREFWSSGQIVDRTQEHEGKGVLGGAVVASSRFDETEAEVPVWLVEVNVEASYGLSPRPVGVCDAAKESHCFAIIGAIDDPVGRITIGKVLVAHDAVGIEELGTMKTVVEVDIVGLVIWTDRDPDGALAKVVDTSHITGS